MSALDDAVAYNRYNCDGKAVAELVQLRARLEVAERLLRIVADEEECGGLIIDEANDVHNKRCVQCQRVLAARAVLQEWKAER